MALSDFLNWRTLLGQSYAELLVSMVLIGLSLPADQTSCRLLLETYKPDPQRIGFTSG
jgi:hypothetical protein